MRLMVYSHGRSLFLFLGHCNFDLLDFQFQLIAFLSFLFYDFKKFMIFISKK